MQNISDPPFDHRFLIHGEAWFPGGPRIPKSLNCLKNRKNHRSLIHGEGWFPPCFEGKIRAKIRFNIFLIRLEKILITIVTFYNMT